MNTEYTVAEVQLTYKRKASYMGEGELRSSIDVYRFLLSIYPKETIEYRESFKVLYLNNCGKAIGYTTISEGGIDTTCVDVRMILQGALLCNATQIILSHNHPSGNLNPSTQDISLTKKIKDAAAIMQIRLVDHTILTTENYYSFSDDGKI